MKKVALIMIGLLFTVFAFGQVPATKPNVKYHVPLTVATESTTFGSYVYAGTPIFCADDSGVVYVTKTYDWSAGATLANVKASIAYYQTYTLTTFGTHGTTYYVDTATAQTITGAKDFLGLTTFGGGIASGATVSGTITVTGKETMSSATPLAFTSTSMTKGLDFGASRLTAGAANAAFAYGTWSTPVYVKATDGVLAGHYVPIQVNLHSSIGTSGAYDIAAARFRVDADADTLCTTAAINVLEGRSDLNGTVAGHAGFNMSTNLAGNTTCTGDLVAVLAKLQGTGNVTSANQVYPFESTVTATGSGILGVGYFDANGCTVTDGVKVETHNSATLTSMLNLANSSGTVTNGIYLHGTLTHDLKLQSGNYIDNAIAGSITVPNVVKNITPTAQNTTTTISAVQILNGVIKVTAVNNITLTLPTAASLVTALPSIATGTYIDLIIDNSATATGTVTVTPSGTIAAVNPAIITGGATMTFAAGTVGGLGIYFTSTSAAIIDRKW